MKKIIAMISEFSPEHVEAEYKLQPFIPDYIPSIGDIDPMIKVAKWLIQDTNSKNS